MASIARLPSSTDDPSGSTADRHAGPGERSERGCTVLLYIAISVSATLHKIFVFGVVCVPHTRDALEPLVRAASVRPVTTQTVVCAISAVIGWASFK